MFFCLLLPLLYLAAYVQPGIYTRSFKIPSWQQRCHIRFPACIFVFHQRLLSNAAYNEFRSCLSCTCRGLGSRLATGSLCSLALPDELQTAISLEPLHSLSDEKTSFFSTKALGAGVCSSFIESMTCS